MLALIAVYLACFRDYRRYLQPGERGTVIVIAADRRQARTIMRYVRGMLTRIPMLTRLIERETAESFDLTNDVSIEMGRASFRATRGLYGRGWAVAYSLARGPHIRCQGARRQITTWLILAHRMSYQSDIFISYRREKNAWTPWARDIFKLALESVLQRELGDPPKVFIDDRIPVGTNFVNHLARTLATSKVMVALLSKDYFSSDWCVHELDLMMEKAQGYDLIIPIVVHDGQAIPDAVSLLQYADFRSYAIPALSHAGPLHAEFWSRLVALAPRIGDAVERAPDFNPKWEVAFKQRLTQVNAAFNASKRLPPKQFRLKATAPLKTPPRMKV